jgi:hypothetical protein
MRVQTYQKVLSSPQILIDYQSFRCYAHEKRTENCPKSPSKGGFFVVFCQKSAFLQNNGAINISQKIWRVQTEGVILRQKQDKDSGLAVDTRNGQTPFSFLCHQANIYPRKCRYHLRDFFLFLAQQGLAVNSDDYPVEA